MTDNFDEDGFEIPEEYWPLATEKEVLMCLSLNEYNLFLNKDKLKAERYRLECIKRHLRTGKMFPEYPLLSSRYNPETNSIECREGYEFIIDYANKTCFFQKVEN